MDLTDLTGLSAVEAARLIREGVVSWRSRRVWRGARSTRTCRRGRSSIPSTRWRRRGRPTCRMSGSRSGPLHGVPVGLKDIIDTADMPTENGSVLHAGRTPSRDASVVSLLRAAGRGHHGQDGHDRVRHPHAGQDAQPAQPGAHPGRLLERLGRGGRGGHGPAGARQPDERLDDPARPRTAASTGSSRRTASSRATACSSSRARSITSGCSRARSRTSRCCSSSSSGTTSAIRTRGRARAFRSGDVAAEEPPLPPMFAFVKTSRWDRVDADAREAFAELVGTWATASRRSSW